MLGSTEHLVMFFMIVRMGGWGLMVQGLHWDMLHQNKKDDSNMRKKLQWGLKQCKSIKDLKQQQQKTWIWA